MKPTRTLESIALFEALKGLLVLLVGLGLFSLLGEDLSTVGNSIIRHLHLNPAHHYPHVFLEAINQFGNKNVLLLSLGALLYSVLRLVEAYGLWKNYSWARWLAIGSAGIYLPVEIYEIWQHVTWIKILVTVFNVGIVGYLLWYRKHSPEFHERSDTTPRDQAE